MTETKSTKVKPRITTVFVDRDGVLNTHLPGRYVERPEQLSILPGVSDAVRRLNDAGVLVIVISNQQGVGLGIMTQDALDRVTGELRTRLFEESGAVIDAVYYCIHDRKEECACRKPRAGMIIRAVGDLQRDVEKSVFVGDSETDIMAAGAAEIGHAVLVLSGSNTYYAPGSFATEPNYVFAGLADVVQWILEG